MAWWESQCHFKIWIDSIKSKCCGFHNQWFSIDQFPRNTNLVDSLNSCNYHLTTLAFKNSSFNYAEKCGFKANKPRVCFYLDLRWFANHFSGTNGHVIGKWWLRTITAFFFSLSNWTLDNFTHTTNSFWNARDSTMDNNHCNHRVVAKKMDLENVFLKKRFLFDLKVK